MQTLNNILNTMTQESVEYDRRFMIMMERIDRLESELFEIRQIKKQARIDCIMSSSPFNLVFLDLCLYLLDCPIELRTNETTYPVPWSEIEYIKCFEVLRELGYVPNQSAIDLIKTLDLPKQPWDLTIEHDILLDEHGYLLSPPLFKQKDYGKGTRFLLESMPIQQLDGYWDWRCKWTGWSTDLPFNALTV